MSPGIGRWLERMVGVGGDEIPADAEVHFVWTNLPQSWRVFVVLFAIAAAVYLSVWLYRRDATRLPVRARRLLTGLRIAVIGLLALLALGPAIAYTRNQVLRPVVVVLRDASQSMAVADRHYYSEDRFAAARLLGRGEGTLTSQPPTRAELLNALLKPEAGSLLDALDDRGQLRVLDFAESVRAVDARLPETTAAQGDDQPKPVPALAPVVPSGVGTNLHQALTEALSEKLTAAIVLLSDGQHTDRATSRDDLIALAGRASGRKVPFLVVGLGDPNRPRNVAVSDVFADARVWKDDPFELGAVLHSEGLGQAPVHVELVEQQLDEAPDQKPAERVLEARDVELPADGGQSRLTFQHTPRVAGRFAYTVRVTPVDRESSTEDNSPPAPAEVKVIDDKARVLLVSGTANWDYRFLRQLLEREKSVDLSCWLQSLDSNRAQEGDTVITKLPRTREELFQYDVILLIDPNPNEFDETWLTLLEEFLREHSGGLMFMAGPAYTSKFLAGAQTAHVRGVLPVALGDVAATEVAGLLESDDRNWDLGINESTLDHPIMRFDSDIGRSMDVWKLFPGVIWSFPVRSAVPTASKLLEHTDPALVQLDGPRPLLVTGQYGGGRTVFLGFDGTWRWREAGRNAEYFNRFWLQTVRYLVEGRSVEGKRRGTIETDRSRYEVGDRITVVARLNDPTFKPLEVPEVKGELLVPGRDPAPVTLRPAAQQPGRYEAVVTALHTGRNVLRISLPDAAGANAPTIETALTISPPSIETARTWQDKPLLTELASASGGQYFGLANVATLPGFIPDRQQTMTVQGKPLPLWDTSRMLLLVVALLGAEWALRKKYKLL